MNQDPWKHPAILKEAQEIKQYYENTPEQLQFILHQKPELAQAVLAEDINQLCLYIYAEKQKHLEKQKQEMMKIAQLNADPFNMDAQKEIEEQIRMQQVDQNMEYAQEYLPESFATVTMLYVEIAINNKPIQAFVDSGAQNTIMSKTCAERCGLMRLIDKRFQGVALGVGQAKIIGRIHAVQMQILDKFITCSLTVLEDDKIDFLFGLDMLKRHQCNIDLEKNQLFVRSANISLPFLAEKDIKRTIQSAYQDSEQLKQQGQPSSQQQQSQQQAQPQSQNIGNSSSQSPYSEQTIKILTDLGFTKQQAIDALNSCNGNSELAASLLFQQNSSQDYF